MHVDIDIRCGPKVPPKPNSLDGLYNQDSKLEVFSSHYCASLQLRSLCLFLTLSFSDFASLSVWSISVPLYLSLRLSHTHYTFVLLTRSTPTFTPHVPTSSCSCTYKDELNVSYSPSYNVGRYTAWFEFDQERLTPILWLGPTLGVELYDHTEDTGLWLDFPGENVNLAGRPEHKHLQAELHRHIEDYVKLK